MHKLGRLFWFGVGGAIGYVAGAKAGRERYEQLVRQTRSTAHEFGLTKAKDNLGDSVRSAAGSAKDAAAAKSRETLDDASDAVGQRIEAVGDQVSDHLAPEHTSA